MSSGLLLLVVTVVASVSPAQQPTATSSYGPTNQSETFDQIKAHRMAVKAARAGLTRTCSRRVTCSMPPQT